MTTQTILKPQSFPMDVFGFSGTNMTIQGFESCNHPNVPVLKKECVFRRETLRDVINFMVDLENKVRTVFQG